MPLNRKGCLEPPLASVWRSRLEMCLGVVLSGAFVVALSSTIRPDPAKVAALRGTPRIESSPAPLQMAQATDPPTPLQSPELVAAVQTGNIVAMRKAFRPGMPLGG